MSQRIWFLVQWRVRLKGCRVEKHAACRGRGSGGGEKGRGRESGSAERGKMRGGEGRNGSIMNDCVTSKLTERRGICMWVAA
eukprot:751083-Hanusia_phi.AAC.4